MKYIPLLIRDNLTFAIDRLTEDIHDTANEILAYRRHDIACLDHTHRPNMEWRRIKLHHDDMVFEDFVYIAACTIFESHRRVDVGRLQAFDTDHK